MKHSFVKGAAVVAALLSVVLVGCGRGSRPQRLQSPAIHAYVFVDQSASPAAADARVWAAAADKAIDRLRSGDAITVFGLHDHTADASAITDLSTDPVPEGAGADGQTGAVTRLRAMKAHAKRAVRSLLADPQRSNWTDILSAWDRVHPDAAGRHVVAFLFTDGLQSMPDLDFERMRLQPQGFEDIIRRAAAAHRWGPTTLANVDVAFVLDGRRKGDARHPIDHKTLRAFYDAMIGALGGRLIAFEPAPSQGGRS